MKRPDDHSLAGYVYFDRGHFVEMHRESWSLNDAADAARDHVARTKVPVIVVWRRTVDDNWQEIDAATEHALEAMR
ncbi:hypothetical protein CH302_19520 [Rhodococcus sp. 15-2388-1-1a]|uniref:hypothetical protein n=1 Tax=Nocardiaceae TaxID=85025 RepID=UPI000569E057|nr:MULTISPECIES: hypothetical protein [Rhodococcus]OZE95131.1 hypothetical protein CH302_19520 [Rhodococcus sp. 15-2388-1-1a]